MVPSIPMNDHVAQEIKLRKLVSTLKVAVAAIAVVAAVVGVASLIQHQKSARNEEAFNRLYEADHLKELASKEAEAAKTDVLDIMKNWPADKRKDYEDKLTGVTRDYAGTTAAAVAGLQLARMKVASGDLPGAETIYKDLLAKVHADESTLVFRAMAFEGLGVTLENQKKFDEAAKAFEQAVNEKSNPLKPLALLGQGRVLTELGKKDQAKQAYEAVLKEYPNTSYERKARALLALDGQG